MIKRFFLLSFCVLALSACGAKNSKVNPTPTAPPRAFIMDVNARPYISLSPRNDGRMLYLKVTGIPGNISKIEYELTYIAQDNGNEIEKGVGDTVKDIKNTFQKDILLGTESCTNGCKYKYDEGVVGGNIIINFITNDGQVATYEGLFTINNGAQVKKNGGISLSDQSFSVKFVPSDTKNWYILLKNYNEKYSLFSNTDKPDKINSTNPQSITPKTGNLGDYQIQP